MRILITGGDGFVGRYFRMKYQEHEIVNIDIKSGNDARDFFKADRSYFDLVIHLAAIVGGRATIEGDPLSVAIDLEIDSAMFNWCLLTKPSRVVYFSSSAAYPTKLQAGQKRKLIESDIDLDDIRSPDYTYGWAKITGEYLAGFIQEAGIRVHVFRPFSGYGTDQDLDYPFPSFIRRAKLKSDPFEIWGDGNQVRDWIHIRDIVDAVDEAIRQDIPGPVNLGNGEAVSFNQLKETVTKIAGYDARSKHLTSAPTGVQYRVSNNEKMLSFYTPKIDLEQGIKMALLGNC
jgi:nucleoside-diphosphate-sugar epimerase